MRAPIRAGTTELVAVDEDASFWEDGAALREALLEPTPRIPPVYGYDERGSELFEDITRLPTYYLTRVERELLRTHALAIGACLAGARFVELGSGSAKKTCALLAAGLPARPAAYLPVDVSREMLDVGSTAVRAAVPASRCGRCGAGTRPRWRGCASTRRRNAW